MEQYQSTEEKFAYLILLPMLKYIHLLIITEIMKGIPAYNMKWLFSRDKRPTWLAKPRKKFIQYFFSTSTRYFVSHEGI